MYTVKPLGINIKQNDREVKDGFLQESINLQWRDGAYRPIPDRIYSQISSFGYEEIIMHKVSDEDKINVLMISNNGSLYWRGVIENGVYTEFQNPIPIQFPLVNDINSLSFTILNGLVYFMSSSQEFYYRLQFNETTNAYDSKDMYGWKELIPFYPYPIYFGGTLNNAQANNVFARCGIILTRFTLVLKTGEEVLHSPIFANYMYSINTSSDTFKKGDLYENIHTVINTNFEFDDMALFNEEISSINVYASIPFYQTKFTKNITASAWWEDSLGSEEARGEIQRMADEPFFLVKTLDTVGSDNFTKNILFYVGELDSNISYGLSDYSKIETSSIAAGSVMPIDNFSYHKVFGAITSSNGRLIIDKPKTVLSKGHIKPISSFDFVDSKVGFHIDTEDGNLKGVAFDADYSIEVSGDVSLYRGLLSYPDSRATYSGGGQGSTDTVKLFKLRANKSHNIAVAYDIANVSNFIPVLTPGSGTIAFDLGMAIKIQYENPDITTPPDPPVVSPVFYTSENRIQFSESGEFSVWPAINSYRVGEGRIMFVGSNSIDPSNSDYIAPLLIGTTDGVYTVNFDVSGVNLIQSITKAATMPALSSENVLVDQNLIYLSDKGLIVINSGQLDNITRDYFPDQGDGGFEDQNTVYPNYDVLTSEFFSGANPYALNDIVEYMRGAVFAYDGRRDNLWCCNPTQNFSLIFNFSTQQWDMSTYVFSKKVEFFSTLNTNEGNLYSRYFVVNQYGLLDILSGENLGVEVDTHLLTRPIKIQSADMYKSIERMVSRCELYRNTFGGYFSFGLWGKQDINKNKINIPLVALSDSSTNAFPNAVRQDIPIGYQKGKYKTITILQSGKFLPSSSLDGFEIVAKYVDNRKLR